MGAPRIMKKSIFGYKSLIHKGVSRDATTISAGKALQMSAKCGANTLGMEKMIGSLEIGEKADIILFDPGKLKSMPVHDMKATIAYSSSAENTDTTIINGKVVYRKNIFSCGVEEAEAAEQMRDEMREFRIR